MKREEILSAIRRNVARSGGVCFPKNFWMNIDGNVKVDYVEADRVVFDNGDYCTFDEFSDEELQLVLDQISQEKVLEEDKKKGILSKLKEYRQYIEYKKKEFHQK